MMKEETSSINWFWVLVTILLVGLVGFGGMVAVKLVREAMPQVEQSHTDPDSVLSTTTSNDNQQTTEAAATPVMAKTQEPKTSKLRDLFKKKEKEEGSDSAVDQLQQTIWKIFASRRIVQPEEPQVEEETELLEDEEDEETEIEQEQPAPAFVDVSSQGTQISDTQKPKPSGKTTRPAQQPVSRTRWHASYKQGLARCKTEKTFPCAWDDVDGERRIVRYWLHSAQGPVERVVYARDNKKRINQTFATANGEVLQYNGTYAQLYFKDGLLTQVRTFPYDNPNLRDWFLIDANGRFSACLCGVPTQDCCSRSLIYRQGSHRRYCELFPLDPDFCTK